MTTTPDDGRSLAAAPICDPQSPVSSVGSPSRVPRPVAVTTMRWVKASRSVGTNACVELARAGELIALRDSKNPDLTPFYYTRAEIEAFLHGAKLGEFDHLLDRGDAQRRH